MGNNEKYITYNAYKCVTNIDKFLGVQELLQMLYERLYHRDVEFEIKKTKTIKRIYVSQITIEFTSKDKNPFDYYAIVYLIDDKEQKYPVNIQRDLKIFIEVNPLDPYNEENWDD